MYRHASTCLNQAKRSWGTRGYSAGESLAATSARRLKSIAQRETESPMRLDLITRVRQEIADGAYDTPDRWEAALDRLLERLDQA